MAQSLAPVVLPKNVWVDLYAATGIATSTKLIVQNSGDALAILTESAAEPEPGTGFNPLDPDEFFTNVSGNVGAWALSSRGTTLQVEETA